MVDVRVYITHQAPVEATIGFGFHVPSSSCPEKQATLRLPNLLGRVVAISSRTSKNKK